MNLTIRLMQELTQTYWSSSTPNTGQETFGKEMLHMCGYFRVVKKLLRTGALCNGMMHSLLRHFNTKPLSLESFSAGSNSVLA